MSALVLLPVTAARADIVYLYDELGRLVRVILPDGEAASYHYDAVGNIRSITRESGVAQTTTVASVSPASADRATTTSVTISGANLSGASVTTSAPGVTIQNLRTDLDSLTFDLIVSADAPLGSATVTLTGEFGTTTITFAINPQPPVIQSFTPAFGPAGATVTISGQFFDDRAPANNTVLFNGVAGIVQTVTTTSIKVTVPGDATSGPITVTHAGGSGTSAGVFITGQVAATAVTPASGTRGNTVRVAVSGTNLLGTTLSRPATTFTNLVASATEVAADAAISLSAAREGVITVSNRVTTATIGFPVEPGIPIVTSLTPIAGAVGDMVNVDGGGFDEVVTANNVVRFNGVASDIVSVAPTNDDRQRISRRGWLHDGRRPWQRQTPAARRSDEQLRAAGGRRSDQAARRENLVGPGHRAMAHAASWTRRRTRSSPRSRSEYSPFTQRSTRTAAVSTSSTHPHSQTLTRSASWTSRRTRWRRRSHWPTPTAAGGRSCRRTVAPSS